MSTTQNVKTLEHARIGAFESMLALEDRAKSILESDDGNNAIRWIREKKLERDIGALLNQVRGEMGYDSYNSLLKYLREEIMPTAMLLAVEASSTLPAARETTEVSVASGTATFRAGPPVHKKRKITDSDSNSLGTPFWKEPWPFRPKNTEVADKQKSQEHHEREEVDHRSAEKEDNLREVEEKRKATAQARAREKAEAEEREKAKKVVKAKEAQAKEKEREVKQAKAEAERKAEVERNAAAERKAAAANKLKRQNEQLARKKTYQQGPNSGMDVSEENELSEEDELPEATIDKTVGGSKSKITAITTATNTPTMNAEAGPSGIARPTLQRRNSPEGRCVLCWKLNRVCRFTNSGRATSCTECQEHKQKCGGKKSKLEADEEMKAQREAKAAATAAKNKKLQPPTATHNNRHVGILGNGFVNPSFTVREAEAVEGGPLLGIFAAARRTNTLRGHQELDSSNVQERLAAAKDPVLELIDSVKEFSKHIQVQTDLTRQSLEMQASTEKLLKQLVTQRRVNLLQDMSSDDEPELLDAVSTEDEEDEENENEEEELVVDKKGKKKARQ